MGEKLGPDLAYDLRQARSNQRFAALDAWLGSASWSAITGGLWAPLVDGLGSLQRRRLLEGGATWEE